MVLLLCGSSACNVSRFLEEDEILYNKVDIKFEDKEGIENPSDLKEDLYWVGRPLPNRKWFGLFKINLWAYYKGKDGEKGFKAWLKRRGEEPVLLDSALVENNCRRMETYLFNNGYYNADVDYETKIADHNATVTYVVGVAKQYTIDSIAYHTPSPDLKALVNGIPINRRPLKKGDAFSTTKLDEERKNIVDYLQNQGYFKFEKKHINFQIDSSKNDHTIDVFVNLTKPEGEARHETYYINDIYVYTDYYPGEDVEGKLDTVEYGGYYFISQSHIFKPQNMVDKVFIKKGELYSAKTHQKTFENFLEMEAFKFVNMRFNEKEGKPQNKLDCYIFLTPLKRMKYSMEAELNNRFTENPIGDGSLGTALTATYLNRNFFKGAEQFSVNIFGGVEFDLFDQEGKRSLINTINLSGQANLTIPKFMLPFPKKVLPKTWQDIIRKSKVNTTFSLSDNFVRLLGFYSINATEFRFGYDWRPNSKTRHILSPISVASSFVYNPSDTLTALLESDLRLKRSFENRLIIGGSYSYINTNQQMLKRNKYFFRADLELAGNMINFLENSLLTTGLIERSFDEILGEGLDYSQFIRIQADYRYYLNFYNSTTLVARVYGGLGIPYSNSNVLPFIRQFFSGGSTGVRAFRIRGIGPGTYVPTGSASNIQFERTGDIKLEANLEYRFPLYWYFKGAFFVDAGNVWTLKYDSLKVGSQFDAASFLNEFGVGAGFGLRFDFSYFVLRFDFSTPLYKPFELPGERWLGRIQLGDAAWRRENLLLQLGIGYPF